MAETTVATVHPAETPAPTRWETQGAITVSVALTTTTSPEFKGATAEALAIAIGSRQLEALEAAIQAAAEVIIERYAGQVFAGSHIHTTTRPIEG